MINIMKEADNYFRTYYPEPIIRIINVYSSLPPSEQNKEHKEWAEKYSLFLESVKKHTPRDNIELQLVLKTCFAEIKR